MSNSDYLQFTDWLDSKEEGWITVAEYGRDEKALYTTTSVLVKIEEDVEVNVLEDNRWLVGMDYGNIVHSYYPNEDKYTVEKIEQKNNIVTCDPFVIHREFNDLRKSHFEVIQQFILYHNLFPSDSHENFSLYNADDEERLVMKISKVQNNESIKIKEVYLREFLAAYGFLLVRQHAHTRTIYDAQVLSSTKKVIKDSKMHYRVLCDSVKQDEYGSYLRGKDIILPLEEEKFIAIIKDKTHGKEKEYGLFIVGTDDNDNNIRKTCNEYKLMDQEFLTVVYFDRKVLNKYYDGYPEYTIKNYTVWYNHQWCISFFEDNSYIKVFLGDLGRIPYREQSHWLHHNTLENECLRDQPIDSWLLEPTRLIERFKYNYSELNDTHSRLSGENFFKDFLEDDMYCIDVLHVPTGTEQQEFDTKLTNLAKILVDALNKKLFIKRTGISKKDQKPIDGISALTNYLSLFVDNSRAESIVGILREIQSYRSASSAHIKGTKYRHKKKDYDKKTNTGNNYEVFSLFIRDSITALRTIINILNIKYYREAEKQT